MVRESHQIQLNYQIQLYYQITLYYQIMLYYQTKWLKANYQKGRPAEANLSVLL
jgi:hypothetical protein